MKKILALCITFAMLASNTVLAREVSISEATLADGTITAVITSDEEISAVMYGAKYDELGLLTNLAVREVTLLAGEKTYTLENVQDGSELMLWDANLDPLLTTPVTVNEKQGDGIIHLNETSIDATGVENATVDGTNLLITAAGTYEIEGTLVDGQITVSDALTKSDKVELVFNNVSVSNSTTAPFNGAGAKITLNLKEGTTNIFTDSCTAKYSGYVSEDAPKGAFYSRRDLTIKGAGSLVVNANYKNGLIGGADLEIKKGASVTVDAVNNAIKADNSVTIEADSGAINVKSAEGDGIKTDAIDSDTGLMEEDKGYVSIEGSTVTIEATAGDGIQADNYISVTGGVLNITSGTEGLKANEVNVPLSADDVALTDDEGNQLYGNGKIYISNAQVTVAAGEDGIKATELVDIKDGAVVNVTATAIDEADNSGYDCIQAGETEEAVSEDGSTTTKTIVVYGDINIADSTVNIIGCSDDAITSNGNVTISGNAVVKGKTDGDFIKAYESVEITGGEFEIECTKDGIQAGTALVESTDGTESNYTTGNVLITGGTFNIKSNGGHTTTMADTDPSAKGIKGITDVTITGGTFTIDTADDALHSNYNLTVTGGQYNIATGDDGLHADFVLTIGTQGGSDDDLLIDVSTSYEGIEGSVINIYSGTQYLYATDDGINAAGDYKEDGTLYESSSSSSGSSSSTRPGGSWGSGAGGGMSDDTSPCGMLYVKGGKTYVEAYGDGMDSNGSIEMSDGVVIINGPLSGGNGVFDIGDSGSTFNITGGTLIGAGASDMAVTPDKISNGYYLNGRASGGMGSRPGSSSSSSASYNAGTPVKITTSTGNIVFVPKVKSSWLFVTTPDMQSGSSYTASTVSSYSGGTQVLGKTVNGVFYGLVENAETN